MKFKTNFAIRAIFGLLVAFLISESVLSEPLATGNNTKSAIEYEIQDGKITLLLNGLNLEEIVKFKLNGKSVDIWFSEDIKTEYTDNGLIIRLNHKAALSGAGLIEIELANGQTIQKYILGGPIPTLDWITAASCTTAPAVYNAVTCDSTKSDVGTPPYPCCDNNKNGKSTDSVDGNCTWYAWYRAKKSKGWTVPSNWGSANNWCANAAKTSGWKVSSTPSINTIACSSSIGHVGWVTNVSSDKKTITLAEQNCKVSPYCISNGGTRNKNYNSASFQYISKNTATVGYASVSQGVTISPATVVLGQNFTISFTLKETRGANKTFENIAIAILDPSGNFILILLCFLL